MSALGETLVELVESFSERDSLELSWFSATAELLFFCRAHQPVEKDWTALLGGEPFRTIRDSTTMIAAELRRADDIHLASDTGVSGFPSRDALRALQQAVASELVSAAEPWAQNGGSRDFLAVAVARAAANAIDQIYGETFLEWFRGDGEIVITSDSPFPVTPRRPSAWIGQNRANTAPDNMPTRDLAATAHLRLGPRTSNYRLVLDLSMWHLLGSFGNEGSASFAVGQPNLHLGEFEVERPVHAAVYYNRGPVDTGAQAARLLDQIVAAGRQGADLIVLPEYAANRETLEQLETEIASKDHLPKLIVIGLCETDESGEVVDRAWMCVPGHGKRNDGAYRTPPKMFGARIDGREEGIRTGSEVRIFVTREWTFVVLICRDAMSAEVVRAASEIGVNLVVVPSMSPRSASMVDTLVAARVSSQAFVVLANGPAHWIDERPLPPVRGSGMGGDDLRVEGAFLGPYAEPVGWSHLLPGPPSSAVSPRSEERGFWTFQTKNRHVEWHSVQ